MKKLEYSMSDETWFWLLVFVCVCIGYIFASLINPQFQTILEDISSTTLGQVVQECDPAAEAPMTLNQMVLGTRYITQSDEIFKRWIDPTSLSEDFNYPEDLTEISHYTSIYRPNYPSIVELYSYSADTTWFRVYPDNFNSVNTRACGTYQAVR